MPAQLAVRYDPGATVRRLIHSTAFIREILGPRGEGKTTGVLYALIAHAERHDPAAWPLRVAIVRDTYQNLVDKFIPTLREERALRGLPIEGIDTKEPRVAQVAGRLELYLFGMDDLPDANKFLGLQIGALWIEEAAPAADLTSGVPADVLGLGVTSLRQQGFDPVVFVSSNAPDEDHWTLKVPEALRELGQEAVSCELLWVPKGENQEHLPLGYHERNAAVLRAIGREDLVERLVEGRVGTVALGLAVTPEFSPGIHVAPAGSPFPWYPGEVTAVRFWDWGLNPTCLMGQLTPMGQLRLHASLVGENLGAEQLIEGAVIPWCRRRGIEPHRRRFPGWLDIGDPAGATAEQSNAEQSATLTLHRLLGAAFQPAPVEWAARRDASRGALLRLIGPGRPLVVIANTPDTKALRRALAGGWHYKRLASGQVLDRPVKDIHSHPGDAFGYGCAVLFPQFLQSVAGQTGRRDYPGWRGARGAREGADALHGKGPSWMSAGLAVTVLAQGLMW